MTAVPRATQPIPEQLIAALVPATIAPPPIPAPLPALPRTHADRTLRGIGPGQPVLLAALTGHGVLAIHPAATITRLLARLHNRLLGERHDR
jgi:hypothetical protein